MQGENRGGDCGEKKKKRFPRDRVLQVLFRKDGGGKKKVSKKGGIKRGCDRSETGDHAHYIKRWFKRKK